MDPSREIEERVHGWTGTGGSCPRCVPRPGLSTGNPPKDGMLGAPKRRFRLWCRPVVLKGGWGRERSEDVSLLDCLLAFIPPEADLSGPSSLLSTWRAHRGVPSRSHMRPPRAEYPRLPLGARLEQAKTAFHPDAPGGSNVAAVDAVHRLSRLPNQRSRARFPRLTCLPVPGVTVPRGTGFAASPYPAPSECSV